MDGLNQGPHIPKNVIDDAEILSCDECANESFVPVFQIMRVSPLVSPNGQEILAPMQTFACSKFGHINDKFNF